MIKVEGLQPEDKDLPLKPELNVLLQNIFGKLPHLTYVVDRIDRLKGKEHIYAVKVFDGIEHVGDIAASEMYSRGKGTHVGYRIKSPRIQKQRGDPHTSNTTNPKVAEALVLRNFSKPTPIEKGEAIVEAMRTQLNTLLWWGKRDYQDAGTNLHRDALTFCMNYHENRDTTLPQNFVDFFSSKKFKDLRDKYNVVSSVEESFVNGECIIVKVEKDNTLSIVTIKPVSCVPASSTYDLPKEYQEKLAILKIMESEQFVDNVGVKTEARVNDSEKVMLYLLVAGDTVVTH